MIDKINDNRINIDSFFRCKSRVWISFIFLALFLVSLSFESKNSKIMIAFQYNQELFVLGPAEMIVHVHMPSLEFALTSISINTLLIFGSNLSKDNEKNENNFFIPSSFNERELRKIKRKIKIIKFNEIDDFYKKEILNNSKSFSNSIFVISKHSNSIKVQIINKSRNEDKNKRIERVKIENENESIMNQDRLIKSDSTRCK